MGVGQSVALGRSIENAGRCGACRLQCRLSPIRFLGVSLVGFGCGCGWEVSRKVLSGVSPGGVPSWVWVGGVVLGGDLVCFMGVADDA